MSYELGDPQKWIYHSEIVDRGLSGAETRSLRYIHSRISPYELWVMSYGRIDFRLYLRKILPAENVPFGSLRLRSVQAAQGTFSSWWFYDLLNKSIKWLILFSISTHSSWGWEPRTIPAPANNSSRSRSINPERIAIYLGKCILGVTEAVHTRQ